MERNLITVAATGGDFTSLAEAVEAARELTGHTRIEIRGGTYHIGTPILMDANHANLTIAAADGETVTLTGAKPLGRLDWKPCERDSRILRAEVSVERMDALTVNGVPQTMARYPNETVGKVPLGGAADADDIRARAAGWAHPETGRIRALHEYGWGGNDYLITGRDEHAPLGLRLRWVGDNNRGDRFLHSAVVVENIFEELDAPREWFYDSAHAMLYLYPEEGVDLTTAEIQATGNPCLLRLVGVADAPVRNVTIENLIFTDTARTLFDIDAPDGAYIPLMRGDWCVAKRGAIYLENTCGITISGCRLERMGGNGIFLYGHHDGNAVTDCILRQIGASGIQIIGDPDAVDDPSFWEHALYPGHPVHAASVRHPEHMGPVNERYPRDITVENCVIEDIGIYEKQSSGVNLSVASRVKILHNTIHHSARSCININDGSFGGHEIAYNDIFDAPRETADHGPLNAWGRDRFWSVPEYDTSGEHGELIRHYTNDGVHYYDIALLDAYQTTTIHDNRFVHQPDAPHSWGIDLDDGSSNYDIYRNLCLGAGIKLRDGFDRRVYNNIIIGGRMEIHVSFAEARDKVSGNIICDARPWNFIGVDKARFLRAKYEVTRNAYFSDGADVSLPEPVRGSIGDVFADPMFRDASANDYTVCNAALARQIGFVNFPMDRFGSSLADRQAPVIQAPAGLAKAKQRAVWNGASVTDIDDAVISATGTYGYDGVYLEAVPADSGAYALGFRPGDIAREADGVRICGIADVGKLGGCATVIRQGRQLRIALPCPPQRPERPET